MVALARRNVRDVLVFLLFLGVTTLWFHHLMAHLGNAVLLGPNDESYGIRTYWGNEFIGKTPFTAHRDPLNGAPEGLPVSSAVQIANFLIPASIWSLHWLFGFTAAANLFLLGGFVLTGFSVYLLLDRLGIHPLAAIYAGYAVAFNPWMIERSYAGHGGFMQAWVFPLQIATMLYAHRARSIRSAVLAGLALTVSFYESSYYGLLSVLVFGVFWVLELVREKGRSLWPFTFAGVAFASSVVAFLPALIAWRGDKQAVAANVSNPLQDLQNLGAAPESYILPSVRNPVLGGITRHFDPIADSHWAENTLYLGWSLLILGLIGAWLVIRRYPDTFATPTRRFFFVGMTVLAPAAFLCSLKRETSVFGLDVPMPSYVIGQFTTFWRVFARFGLLVTFALAVLAALTLTALMRRTRYGVAIFVAAMLLLGFEYYNGVAPAYTFEATPYSKWIAKQPPGSVANYPLPTDAAPALRLLANTFYQQIFNKHPQFALFGSGYGGTREDGIRIMARYVQSADTAGILKAESVRYVLLHDDVYRQVGEEPPADPPGMHLVARLPGNVRAFELNPDVVAADLPKLLDLNAATIGTAQALRTPDLSLRGFSDPYARSGEAGWRKLPGEGQVVLTSHDTRVRRGQLVFNTVSGGVPRTLQLIDDNGTVVRQVTVATTPTQVLLGAFDIHGRTTNFTLRTDPAGPIEIGPVAVQPLADFSTSILDN
jgi:hypothetical protein